MKIYILRHEDRTQDCSFFSPLTQDGLDNAQKLISKLTELKINLIFSSPFIRTLQTIYPYVKNTKQNINLEYGLSELHHPDIIPSKAVGISLPEYLSINFNYNPNYKTIVKPTDIIYPEQYLHVLPRVKKVLKDIIMKYYNTDLNIILVTHHSICKCILNIVNQHSKEYKNKVPIEILNNYNTGVLCLVYNNEWVYKIQ
jgi:broad specificity phosphatase PhoE